MFEEEKLPELVLFDLVVKLLAHAPHRGVLTAHNWRAV